jgi:hypothetical protein
MFRQPVKVEVGEVVERDGFFFADVMPSLSFNLQIITEY